ncbi:hypothetical protein [Amycolatopsis sp. NPDC051128]|uniref:hypothetical protein n=1 Tax=Amycolatopsis sp. NPDC051128 TaxID=3155412 RepID=UPI00342DFDA8
MTDFHPEHPNATDVFGGPGGWDVAARPLGIRAFGIEWDSHACATRRAAGLLTLEDDVRYYDLLQFDRVRWVLAALDNDRPYEWLAFEQVSTVLPVWECNGRGVPAEGYTVESGKLSAEQYAVPQTRKRAFLVARLHGEKLAHPPNTCVRHPLRRFRRRPTRADGARDRQEFADQLSRKLHRCSEQTNPKSITDSPATRWHGGKSPPPC